MKKKQEIILSGIAALVLLGSPGAYAEHPPRRLSAPVLDLGKVHPIHMIPGNATLIEIPGPITGVHPGSQQDLKFEKEGLPDNEVLIRLARGNAQTSNLIIRSVKKKYVFDIIPSKTVHRDIIEIPSSFGGPEIDTNTSIAVESSDDREEHSPTKSKAAEKKE